MKHVEVEYIESGAFQGGEEDVSTAGIKYGEECVALSKKEFDVLVRQRDDAQALLREILGFHDRHGSQFARSFIDRIRTSLL